MGGEREGGSVGLMVVGGNRFEGGGCGAGACVEIKGEQHGMQS